MERYIRKLLRLLPIPATMLIFVGTGWGQIEKPSQAILRGLPDNVYVEVTLGKEFPTISQMPTGSLFSIDKDGNEIEIANLPNNIASPFRNFRISLPVDKYNADLSYEVLVFVVPAHAQGQAPIKKKKSIKVTGLFTVEMLRGSGCEGIQLRITTPLREAVIWNPIYTWLNQFTLDNAASIATVKIRVIDSPNERDYHVTNVRWKPTALQKDAGVLRACLEFDQALPRKDFNATFEFHGPNRPPQITTAEGEELAAAFSVDYPKLVEPEAPEKRQLERNLDVGLALTSSVADETTPASGTTPEMTSRKRTNKGVFDVRFAPWMDVLHPVIRPNRWLHFLTPVYLNANVSTGKIDKDTLSLNRVLIGLQGESRYIVRRDTTDDPATEKDEGRITYPLMHRLTWGFTHASDRDFKQKEFVGKIEYSPLIDALYQPYVTNYKVDKDGFIHQKWYGFTFLPLVGFEMGRTYSRQNPAAAIQPSPTARRFYFGGDIALDLSAYLTFSFTDYFYVRGENPQDHFKNYFKGTSEFRLGRSTNKLFAQSLFVSFERGQQPPFATPDVNALKIGYRLQGNYCGNHCR
ncbi:MAG TPA: hypothetical protein VJU86_17980 [Pyrinomonadaceae bacterium]|nr:hypothetical protein [Pyrinomonadaceae bacterium]